MPMSSASAQKQEIYERIVDTLIAIFGTHPGYRSVHAKGIVCEGTFTPSASAASLSRAPHFKGGAVPMTVRFSDFAGVPSIPDNDPNASPRGLGIKFHLPGGEDTDIVAHSYNGFPVATAEEFLAFLQALAATTPDRPKPTPIEAFLGARPRAFAFATAPKPIPSSFVNESYFGVNAFRFINGKGSKRYARYQVHPANREAHLSDAEASQRSPNFLLDELRKRLLQGPAELKLFAQLAEAGDKIDDASITWPDDRPKVELGSLKVIKSVADTESVQRKLIFDPTRLVDGIELSEDPLLPARADIYSIGYKRRNP